MRKIIFMFVILLGMVGCKKEEPVITPQVVDECKDIKQDLKFEIQLCSYMNNFEDVRLANGELDTSKMYIFFYDKGVKKIIATKNKVEEFPE